MGAEIHHIRNSNILQNVGMFRALQAVLMRTARQQESYFKGAANHWRISILLVDNKPVITVAGPADVLHANIKTVSQHTLSLVRAGLLNKRYQGRQAVHTLYPYGKAYLNFMLSF